MRQNVSERSGETPFVRPPSTVPPVHTKCATPSPGRIFLLKKSPNGDRWLIFHRRPRTGDGVSISLARLARALGGHLYDSPSILVVETERMTSVSDSWLDVSRGMEAMVCAARGDMLRAPHETPSSHASESRIRIEQSQTIRKPPCGRRRPFAPLAPFRFATGGVPPPTGRYAFVLE